MSGETLNFEKRVAEGPLSHLESKLVEEYLQNKGYTKDDLQKLPKATAKRLMKEACTYASLKLAEIEAKSQFRKEIRYE